jgi:hypothetical protein
LTSLLLGTIDRIGANMQPRIAYHEVLLVGVDVGPVAATVLCRGQQDVLEQWLAVDVACRPLLGLDTGDGAVIIVGLGGILRFANRHGSSNGSQRTKTRDQGEYLIEHGLRRYLTEQVGCAGEVIDGVGSWSLAVLGRCVARNMHAVEVDDGLECATVHRKLCRNTEARRAADWEGGSCVDDRAGDAGRCHPATDNTELSMDPNWSPANWVTTSLLSMATAWTAHCLAKASAVALA